MGIGESCTYIADFLNARIKNPLSFILGDGLKLGGSSGGAGNSSSSDYDSSLRGGDGAGTIILIAPNIVISGTVQANGEDTANAASEASRGKSPGGGGGAGAVMINAVNLTLTGATLEAKGGDCGNPYDSGSYHVAGSDGGSGGLVYYTYYSLTGSPTTDVTGGTQSSTSGTASSGSPGDAGTVVAVDYS